MRLCRFGLVCGLLLVVAAACGPALVSVTPGAPTPTGSVAPPTEDLTSCAVTIGEPGTKPPQFDPDVLPVPYVDTWYGNDAIWIRLPIGGILPATRDTTGAELWAKFPWWRLVPGPLQVWAQRRPGNDRLDAEVGTVPEYGTVGFVPSGLLFSRAGCWEITGSLNGQTLSFTTVVITDR